MPKKVSFSEDSEQKKSISEEKIKRARISSELNRLTAYFEPIEEKQMAIIGPLLQNAAFMRITLEDLQEIINRDGPVERYQNGANQYGLKQSSAVQSYNALMKNYAAVIKTLAQILPPDVQISEWQISQALKEKTEEQRQAEIEESKAESAYWVAKLKLLRENNTNELIEEEPEGYEKDDTENA